MKKDKNSFLGGARLREERERLGLLQEDAEIRFGVSRVTWGKYERGESEPGANVLMALINLGADVLYILTGSRSTYQTEQERAGYGNHLLSNAEQELLDNYGVCSEEGKSAINTISASLAKSSKEIK